MAVGGFRSYDIIQQAIKEHNMDFISMARPLIREPALASRWKQGDHSPAKCISCNKCFLPGIKEGGIYCVVEKKARERASKIAKSENQLNWMSIIHRPYTTSSEIGISKGRTSVKRETKYIGAFGFKALQTNPTPTYLMEECSLMTCWVDSPFLGLAFIPCTPR